MVCSVQSGKRRPHLEVPHVLAELDDAGEHATRQPRHVTPHVQSRLEKRNRYKQCYRILGTFLFFLPNHFSQCLPTPNAFKEVVGWAKKNIEVPYPLPYCSLLHMVQEW